MKNLLALALAALVLNCSTTTPASDPEHVVRGYLAAKSHEEVVSYLAPTYRLWFGERKGDGMGRDAAAKLLEWDFALNPRHRVDSLTVDGSTVTARVHEENDFSLLIGFPGWDSTSTYVVENGQIVSQLYVAKEGRPEWRPYLDKPLEWLRANRADALGRVFPNGKLAQSRETAAEWVKLLREWRAATAQSDPTVREAIIVHAVPEKGFHYPYLLRMPHELAPKSARYLLVETNNTGAVSDDFKVHVDAATKLSRGGLGAYVARRLDLPYLMPIFPRPKTNWEMYTHQLDRDVMSLKDGPLRRLDLQLIAMIDDARERLRSHGYEVDEQVLMTGFSASATFANRFTMIHPERVRAVATGGLNGLVMIPHARLNQIELPYPLGLADFEQITARRFNERAWRNVPQFIYMGAKDDNDALHFGDGYSDEERGIVYAAIGEKMQPDRWQRGQDVYKKAGANAKFTTYEHAGHWTDAKINNEIVEFFRNAGVPPAGRAPSRRP